MSSSYAVPIVHRTSDPLVIRTSDTSLLVNDTTYNVVVKCGNLFCGFYVYMTGHGYPVYKYKDEDLTSSLRGSGSEATICSQLEMYAKGWVDELEEAILSHRSDNELKKAIDRLTWQLHYDITESNTDFVEMFPDFSDISIDKSGYTIYSTVTTSATNLGNAVGEGANVIIGDSTSGAGIWSVSNTISGMSNSVCGKLDTMSSNISTLDSNLNGSSGSIKTYIGNIIYSSGDTGSTPTTLCGYINKVATNLRADADGSYQEYTISKALREYVPGASSQEKSVSGATKDQTDLEQRSFTEISVHQLGAFGEGETGDTGHRTLYATLGEYTQSNKNDLSQAVGTTADTSSSTTLTGTAKKIDEALTDANNGVVKKVNDVSIKIGTPLDENGNATTAGSGGDTLFEAVYKHPGFLGFSGNGFSGYLPTTNGSWVSTVNQDVFSALNQGVTNSVGWKVNAIYNNI